MAAVSGGRVRTLMAIAALAIGPAAAGAQSQVLDFTPFLGQPNYSPIPQTYGDLAGVLEVSNRTRVAFGNAAALDCGGGASHVDFWNGGYSDLNGVAFACSDGYVGEFFFQPFTGQQITLGSVNFGSYAAASNGVGPTRAFTMRVYDGAWNLLYDQSLVAASTITATPNLTSTTGLYLQWGTDWNVGIDNIQVTASRAASSVVPEPSTYALLATGLGVLGLVARRRRALG